MLHAPCLEEKLHRRTESELPWRLVTGTHNLLVLSLRSPLSMRPVQAIAEIKPPRRDWLWRSVCCALLWAWLRADPFLSLGLWAGEHRSRSFSRSRGSGKNQLDMTVRTMSDEPKATPGHMQLKSAGFSSLRSSEGLRQTASCWSCCVSDTNTLGTSSHHRSVTQIGRHGWEGG